MKLTLLAAAAFIASPALAQMITPQTTPPASTQTAPDSTMPDQTAPGGTMPDQSAPDGTMPDQSDGSSMQQAEMPATQPMQSPTDPTTSQPATGTSNDNSMMQGGYQPSNSALSAPMTPGATVRFVPAQSPSQAFPPPPAKDNYPICKKGQYDGCRQRGGR